jgi:allantoate deiminase
MRLAIDRESLARDLDELAKIGRLATGGITRLALSDEDARARRYVRDRMEALGLDVSADEVGNLHGRRKGRKADAPVVLSGSHLDSVPQGGAYDGPLGVVGALCAIDAIARAGVETTHPIEVIVFVGEEGSRFRRGTLGSAALTGDLAVADILALVDADGTSFKDALFSYQDAPEKVVPAKARTGSVEAFVELHVEQGGVLERAHKAIGVVEAIAGLIQLIVRFRGDANHAGATPMDARRDALCAAAEATLQIERIARELGQGCVATVGRLDVEPGAANIIPGVATMLCDLRAPQAALLDRLQHRLRADLDEIARARRVDLEVTLRQRVEPGPMAPQVQTVIEQAAAEANVQSLRMPSGAIHDALHMASFCPSGMIFIPSVGGKSHCPDEHSTLEQMELGALVLAHTLARLAG